MNTKLTLRMDESLIAAAKDYAAARGSSVSQMVANYFAMLSQTAATSSQRKNDETSPVTRSLLGILKPIPGQSQVSEDDYLDYLERKYLQDDGSRSAGTRP